MPFRRGLVRLDGEPAGTIEETATGSRFTYAGDWLARPDAAPVSLTLPLRSTPYESTDGLHPFFDNLLPEGALLHLAIQALQLPWNDRFGVLLGTCGDCVGAVEIEPLATVSE